MEIPGVPALICRKCEKHVLQATELKKLCEISENHFRRDDNKNEYYFIHENLRELKALTKSAESAVPEKVSSISPQAEITSPKKPTGFVRTDEIVTRSSIVESLPLKIRRSSLHQKAHESPKVARRTRSITCDHPPKAVLTRPDPSAQPAAQSVDEPPATSKETASTPEPPAVPQVKHEEIVENDCDSGAETEVSDNNNISNDLAFIDFLTLDQIREMTEMLAEIVMPASEKSKKKKKKKDKTRFIQRLAPNKFRIRVSKLKE